MLQNYYCMRSNQLLKNYYYKLKHTCVKKSNKCKSCAVDLLPLRFKKLARPDVVLVLFRYPFLSIVQDRGLINHLAAESNGLHCMCCSFLT